MRDISKNCNFYFFILIRNLKKTSPRLSASVFCSFGTFYLVFRFQYQNRSEKSIKKVLIDVIERNKYK